MLRFAFLCALVFAAFLSRIAIAEGVGILALFAFAAHVVKTRSLGSVVVPPYFYPLAFYGFFSLLASLFAVHPARSLLQVRELLLFSVGLILVNVIRTKRQHDALVATLLLSGIVLSIWGISQYLSWSTDIRARIRGPVSHYMTYSGLILLLALLALSETLYGRRLRLLAAPAAVLLCLALLCTRTRSTWVGLFVALTLYILLRRARLFAYSPLIAILVLSFVPPPVFNRILSTFNRKDETVLSRYYLWQGGIRMIGDHPLLGVGPHMVKEVYMGRAPGYRPKVPYRDPRPPTKTDAHLHNNFLQIAAERGLPALAAWLAIFGVMLAEAARRFRDHPKDPGTVTALLCLTAFLAAGIFEFNFGDSEVLMALLTMVALPQTGLGLQPTQCRAPI